MKIKLQSCEQKSEAAKIHLIIQIIRLYLREWHIQSHTADPTITMIKLLCKWYGRSSALSLIKVCYTVKAVCHRGPCESAQSLVTPLGIHQRFLMGGMVSLELNLFWRAQRTGQPLQPSPCTVHFKGNRWIVTGKKKKRCGITLSYMFYDRTGISILWCWVHVTIKTTQPLIFFCSVIFTL